MKWYLLGIISIGFGLGLQGSDKAPSQETKADYAQTQQQSALSTGVENKRSTALAQTSAQEAETKAAQEALTLFSKLPKGPGSLVCSYGFPQLAYLMHNGDAVSHQINDIYGLHRLASPPHQPTRLCLGIIGFFRFMEFNHNDIYDVQTKLPFAKRSYMRSLNQNKHIRLAYSPDGTKLASKSSSSSDCFVDVWNTSSGQHIAQLDSDARSLAWAPDSNTLVIGNPNSTINVWNTRNVLLPNNCLTLNENTNGAWVETTQYSPCGKFFVSGSGYTIKVWYLHPQTQEWTSSTVNPQQKIEMRACAFSPDGKRLAIDCVGGIHVIDPQTWNSCALQPTWKPIAFRELYDERSPVVTWSPDSMWLAIAAKKSAGLFPEVLILDPNTLKSMVTFNFADSQLERLATENIHSIVWTASGLVAANRNKIKIWPHQDHHEELVAAVQKADQERTSKK